MPETRTETLAEFVLAGIAEDEATARRASVTSVAESRPPQGRWWSEWRDEDADQERGFQPRTFGIMEGMATLADVDADSGPGERGSAVAEHIVRHDPTRVLAECEAKRRIVEMIAGPPPYRESDYIAPEWKDVLLALAQPCADRDGFREEWRP